MEYEEALQKLKELVVDTKASEDSHVEADRILCEFLTSLGYKDVVELYDKLNKWYA